MKEKSPEEIFNNCALLYEEKFMNFDLYHDTFDFFCEAITKNNASVLEIGCGPGNITKYLLNKKPDLTILGIDIASTMIELAIKNNPLANFEVMDCKNINSLTSRFDGIMCGFTLPYLNKDEAGKLIKDASEIINDNGILYLSTMEDAYDKSKIIFSSINKNSGVFTYYHQEKHLSETLLENGFIILKIYRKEYPEPKDDSKDLIIIAKKLS
jgi:2-polyprenyl-3-methyl-5-hydroxy-6-metoxy-1,4-benzoquinol methylase